MWVMPIKKFHLSLGLLFMLNRLPDLKRKTTVKLNSPQTYTHKEKIQNDRNDRKIDISLKGQSSSLLFIYEVKITWQT